MSLSPWEPSRATEHARVTLKRFGGNITRAVAHVQRLIDDCDSAHRTQEWAFWCAVKRALKEL